MSKLLINEGGQASVFELFDDEATIGRGAANAIQVADAHSSKNHAVVRRVSGRVKLVDLESKNGTRVNGEFRNQRWLQHGDAISIGAAVLTFDASEAEDVVEDVAPAAAFVAASPTYGGSTASPVSRSSRSGASRSGESGGGSGARSARRGRDHGGDEDDEAPRRGARRKDNSALVAGGIGVGLIGIVALLFAMMSGKGNPANTTALAYARDLSMRGGKENVQKALDYLTQYGDPADADTYVSVAKEIDGLKQKLLAFDETDVEQAALKEYNKIEFDFIEKHKSGRTAESFGADLVKWADKYKGTRAVGGFVAGYKNPNLFNVYKKAREGGGAPK